MDIRQILSIIKFNKFVTFIIVFQVALSMSVVSNSFFLALKTFREWTVPTGIETEQLVYISSQTYKDGLNMKQIRNDDLQGIAAMDDVINVTPINRTPIAAGWPNTVFLGTGDSKQSFQSNIFDVDANGLDVLGLKVIEGRTFNQIDVIYGSESGSPSVVMISVDMAAKLYPDGSAIGNTLWLAADSLPVEIIGIYSNFLSSQFLAGKGMPYQSILKPKVDWHIANSQRYIMRVQPGTADAVMVRINEYFSKTDGRYIYPPESMEQLKKRAFNRRLGTMVMYLVISALLLVITFCGLLGLISFVINSRTRQIGIRRSLGAKKSTIVKEFIIENGLISLMGLALGMVFTLLISSLFHEFNGVVVTDLVYVIPVGMAIIVLNGFAVMIPAKRAVNITPASAMR